MNGRKTVMSDRVTDFDHNPLQGAVEVKNNHFRTVFERALTTLN
jgi:hypothetical protein